MLRELRKDLKIIAELIKSGSKVIDLGCGTGELVFYLKNRKNCNVIGVEIKQERVIEAISKGVAVYHGDMEELLPSLPGKSYDYAVLSRTLPEVRNPEKVIFEALRVSKYVVLSFANFGYILNRFYVLFTGNISDHYLTGYRWYTPEYVHLITISTFESFLESVGIKVVWKKHFGGFLASINPNLLAPFAIYMITEG